MKPSQIIQKAGILAILGVAKENAVFISFTGEVMKDSFAISHSTQVTVGV